MTNYNKFIFKAPIPKTKISLQKVYKYNRIYHEGKTNKVEVYENDSKYYLVFKGRITTYSDYTECFDNAKKLSETGR